MGYHVQIEEEVANAKRDSWQVPSSKSELLEDASELYHVENEAQQSSEREDGTEESNVTKLRQDFDDLI